MTGQFRSPEPPQAALSPEPVMNSGREQNGLTGKSMANGTATANSTIPGTSSNQTDATDDHGLTRKKVVKVVRRVVRKVLPADEGEAAAPTHLPEKAPEAPKPAAMPAFSFKHDVIKTEDKDDISRGLTNLMVRGRTREPRPRIRRDERPEKVELEKKSEIKEEKVEPGVNQEKPQESQEVGHKPSASGPVTQEAKSPSSAVSATSTNPNRSTPTSAKSTHSRPTSLPPVVGFIPAPKPSSLSPPPGFIPTPKPSPAKKLPPVKTPPTTPVPQKSSSLSSPSCSVSATKSSPCTTPVSRDPALPKTGPLSPPQGVIPAQQPAVSQQEVQCPHLACVVIGVK